MNADLPPSGAAVSDTIVMRLAHPTLPPGVSKGSRFFGPSTFKASSPRSTASPASRGLRAPNFHSGNAASGVDIVLKRLDVSPVVYICGVAMGPEDQRWYRNLHLAVRYKPGATASATTYNGYSIDVRNPTALEIPAVPDGWQGLPLKHTRCKNFGFGLAHFGWRNGHRLTVSLCTHQGWAGTRIWLLAPMLAEDAR